MYCYTIIIIISADRYQLNPEHNWQNLSVLDKNSRREPPEEFDTAIENPPDEFDTAIEKLPEEFDEKPSEEFDTAIEKPEFMSVHREESTCTSEIPAKVKCLTE